MKNSERMEKLRETLVEICVTIISGIVDYPTAANFDNENKYRIEWGFYV